MKRILIIIASFTLLLIFSGCNSVSDENVFSNNESEIMIITTEDTESASNPSNFDGTKVESTSVTTEDISDKNIEISQNEERITVGIFSLEEYNNFVKTTELPDNFIYWEKLSQLGEFKSIVFTSDAYYKKDYSCYLYSFIDETGIEISMYVYSDTSEHHFETYKNQYYSVDEINSPDMRNIDITDKTCVYYNKNLLYTYVGGELSSITWVYEDIEYVLCMISGKGNLCNYPNIDFTLAGKLLNRDKADKALNDFLNSINK